MATVLLTTDGLARGAREEFWRHAMSETFVPLTVGDVVPDRFNGVPPGRLDGRLMVAQLASTAQDIQRT